MAIIRVAYFSHNRLDCFNAPMSDRVAEILATSVANNRRDGITGALVYDDKWFAQVLEGSERAVTNAFERILRDERHCDVRLVVMGPILERAFAASPMAVAVRGAENADLFRHHCESDRFDPALMSADRMMLLIEAVVGLATGASRVAWRATSAA
jgi:hypothetical protein